MLRETFIKNYLIQILNKKKSLKKFQKTFNNNSDVIEKLKLKFPHETHLS